MCAMLPRPLEMFLWLFFLGNVISAPDDDFFGIIQEGELALSDDKYIKYIVPGYLSQNSAKHLNLDLKDLVSEGNEHYKILQEHIESGHAMKGLTFNLYDDNMRETAITLFRLLKNVTDDNVPLIKDWATKNINKDIVDYALRLLSLYKDVDYDFKNNPPFISKPNYFVNSETINKALKLKISNGKFEEREGFINQYSREENIVTLKSNNSGWNFEDLCQQRLNYFREDIGLNSYYYGIHLMYPFWMSNDELSDLDPRFAENYYFIHKQLLARLNLEYEHEQYPSYSPIEKCLDNFLPYLVHDNGVSFPARLKHNIGGSYYRIKKIDIAIKECLDRGFIYMGGGVNISLTENNYVDLIAKLIRSNYEKPPVAKYVKNFYGYGANYPTTRYNSAPSVLHHPETTLRDPIYWSLIENMLNYFSEFSKKLEPYKLAEYETEEFEIVDNSFSKMTTFFNFYKFKLNNIFGVDDSKSLIFAARKERLNYLPFTLNFTVSSLVNKTGHVRLFLGPQCEETECWKQYHRFFELDIFPYTFSEGMNYVSWSSETSSRYSFDDYYNLESRQPRVNRYDMFKFPANLMIPRGLEQGLKFTLFVMVTPQSDVSDTFEPFGFPFHRPAIVNENSPFLNYKFYNVSVFHKVSRHI
ncbi:arylphorin subunit alpha-like [Aricia agestis]|uniref:arylphorin subunit alpha-like n=1 Tax=Aricia agestis TaxID=91739 RepID=UPI001C20187A|nr:arylphorin subunit alpha-like [Aricia agestis]